MTIITSYANINVNYPVAGQDNDSQGFRNNFTAISNSFAQADSALSDLTTSTAKLNVDNDFLGHSISHSISKNNVGEYVSLGEINDSPHTLYFNQAEYHDVTISTSTTFQVGGWPNNADWTSNLYYARLRLQVFPTAAAIASSSTVNFQPLINGGALHTRTGTQVPYPITTSTSQIWDVWTVDGGQNVYVNLVGQFN